MLFSDAVFNNFAGVFYVLNDVRRKAAVVLLFLYSTIPNLDAIIRVRMLLCETSMLLFVSVCCYAKPRCYYSCLYAAMRVRMLLCETSMLLFVTVCCYAKPRCYYSWPYAVKRNLDAIIRVSNYVLLNPPVLSMRAGSRPKQPATGQSLAGYFRLTLLLILVGNLK